MLAALTQSLSPDNLPVNWFDAALVIVLGFGIFRGRKNGMTKEILPTVQWLIVVVAAGLTYSLVAQFYANTCGLSKLLSAICGYLSIAILVFIIFSAIKKVLTPKLTGSNVFGGAEYYAGMPSGMIRYACILFFALALLNARSYSSAEILQQKIYNERWYGGGIYSGDYIPDLHSVQEVVFKKSFTGPYIQNYMGLLLIQTGPDNGGSAAPAKPQPVIHIGN
jgi:uncharacterized membrane protein required for colicin V production